MEGLRVKRTCVREQELLPAAFADFGKHKSKNEGFGADDLFSFVILIVKLWALSQITFPE